MTTGYPAILLLDGRLAVVIGGGQVAERKVRTLRDAGAKVRLVSDSLTPRLRDLAESGEIELVERRYTRGDLAGAVVAVAATDDEEVNRGVYAEATESGIPVNVVDNTALCTFIAPSIIRQGELVIAISTGGAAPALAVRIRERLEREFGEEYARFLDLTAELRDTVKVPGDQDERAKAWYRVIDSDVMDLVRAGDIAAARERAIALLRGTD
ncbi:MAG TPA: bifunctional precorrin-2 dehydrogenase/sirohydrochlorin ferrochelatase [Actinomycetota bacterium]|nr:bifunctional precorrin-2 dehydrogenase/sirohydrochlorin ferrochelatase [Actinomycetota bacterium]